MHHEKRFTLCYEGENLRKDDSQKDTHASERVEADGNRLLCSPGALGKQDSEKAPCSFQPIFFDILVLNGQMLCLIWECFSLCGALFMTMIMTFFIMFLLDANFGGVSGYIFASFFLLILCLQKHQRFLTCKLDHDFTNRGSKSYFLGVFGNSSIHSFCLQRNKSSPLKNQINHNLQI